MDLSWVKDVERQLRVLAQRTAHLPTRVRGGGGGGGGGTGAPSASDEPTLAVVAEDSDPGISELYSRADHTHVGQPFLSVAGYGDLPSDVPDGVFAVTEEPGVYMRVDGGWERKDTPTVLSLPAIPTHGSMEVFWTSTGGGTGDNQIWRAHAGQTKWYATQKYTSKSGVP